MNAHKKIALVYDAVFPFIKGGAELRFYELGRRLAAQGYDVHLYGMKCWPGENVISFERMTLHGLCKQYPLYTGSGRRSIFQALWFGISSLKLVFEDFDVIDCCGFPYFSLFPCRLATWLKRKPLYATWHEVWGKEYWQEYLGAAGVIGYGVEKLAVRLPDTIISASEHTTRRLRETLGRTAGVVTIPNGVDTAKIHDSPPSERASDIIIVGRLLPNKNVGLLLKAVSILKRRQPGIKLLVVGEGPEREVLEEMSRNLGLGENVIFLGRVEKHEDVFSLMRSSRLFVLPSTREGFGVVVIEANACGLPVVTVRHEYNAARDLIQEGINGLLAEPTAEDIAEKIMIVLTNRDTMDPSAGIEQYDWKAIVHRLEQVLN